ncbi:MAG: 2-hydroxyacyl-CoA dehydratase [Candidatus Abyssobacteria bacterium SURF_5]|uniref:2-hydroxyacyl-CoA dehydratase n=1 Tax=Abyssobacteria bacterium (strain SURF_5) TaxID=2093360 RepID=A0A3A4P5F5_ABYX5|nr:MAG: 2-hydroxyacyl-CoA dehydratase [Candidatus Abyssubacteria bacterium SURF_5]
MGAFEELAEVSNELQNRFVHKWKEGGKKVVGYVCSYLPEEILFAADILPFRITGSGCGETALADSYLTRVNCSFSRCCLELALSGKYSFLDGAVFVNGCDHIRRAYDNWAAHTSALPFMYILPVPHVLTSDALNWYREEVNKLKASLEENLGVKIPDEKLKGAIKTYNDTRSLLQKLYDLRAKDQPVFSGADKMAILAAASRMPKDEFNKLLAAALDESEGNKRGADAGVRLLIAGSVMDDADFIRNVEDLGAVVVADALCYGARTFSNLTDETVDPIEALVQRYFHHVPCPRMAGEYHSRLEFVKQQAERGRVDGVILEYIKFCDLHGTDNALLKNDLEKAGIPALELERQYGPLADAGRVRTRVQAFLERIRR